MVQPEGGRAPTAADCAELFVIHPSDPHDTRTHTRAHMAHLWDVFCPTASNSCAFCYPSDPSPHRAPSLCTSCSFYSSCSSSCSLSCSSCSCSACASSSSSLCFSPRLIVGVLNGSLTQESTVGPWSSRCQAQLASPAAVACSHRDRGRDCRCTECRALQAGD